MILAFDSETHPIQPGLLAPPPVCFSFAWRMSDGGLDQILHEAESGAEVLEGVLYRRTDPLVGHNVAFDLAVLCAYRPDLIPVVFKAYSEGRIHDTKIRQELLDIAAGRIQKNSNILVWRNGDWARADYSLAGLETLYFGRDRSAEKKDKDSWRLRYGELDGARVEDWPEAAAKYALEDAEGTLRVYEAQEQLAGGPITDEVPQARAAWALHLMACWGVRTEKEYVEKLEAALLIEREANERILKKAGILKPERLTPGKLVKKKKVTDDQGTRTIEVPVEPDFWAPVKQKVTKKALREGVIPEFYEDGVPYVMGPPEPFRYKRDSKLLEDRVRKVYERKGLPVPMTDGEEPRVSTDKDTMGQSGSRLLQLVSDGGGVNKILDTYMPVLKRGTSVPINPRFNVLVNSGRTSCAEPNLQNMPTGRRVGGVRDCFIAPPGYLLVSTDYDTFELRALAQVHLWLFGRSSMADAIKAGRELHLSMAAHLLRISYEEALARYNAKPRDKEIKSARDAAKVANFGFPGGLGIDALIDFARTGYGVRLDTNQAFQLKQEYLAAWPEMARYFKYINDKLGAAGESSFTQFVSGRVRGGVGYCDGCNTLFQGLAADAAKRALFNVAQECYVDMGTPLFGSRPVVFVHDEILALVPEDIAHEAATRLTQVMCESAAEVIPDVPISASPALMRRWIKGAEPVYVDGRLVPWESAA